MASTIDKSFSPPLKTHKLYYGTQILLRVFAIAATLAAGLLMLSSKQATIVYGIPADARYSYSPAFKFFAYGNLVAFVFSLLSLIITFILGRREADPTFYFYLFMHDLTIGFLLMAACSAATAIGYVGKYGNSHTGWIAICDHFAKFCNRATASAALSYFAFVFYFILTIISAKISRQIQA